MKTMIGKVTSIKMVKTVVVKVNRQTIHPLYKKIIRKDRKFKAHNEDASIKVGDRVKIVETKPYSKEKNYKVVSKVS